MTVTKTYLIEWKWYRMVTHQKGVNNRVKESLGKMLQSETIFEMVADAIKRAMNNDEFSSRVGTSTVSSTQVSNRLKKLNSEMVHPNI